MINIDFKTHNYNFETYKSERSDKIKIPKQEMWISKPSHIVKLFRQKIKLYIKFSYNINR